MLVNENITEVKKVGVVGVGFVGDTVYKYFVNRGISMCSYDKHKFIGCFEDILSAEILFLCLPTPYVKDVGFDLSSIEETCNKLSSEKFEGIVVLKSTVTPGTTLYLSKKYGLDICHNPEFLTMRTKDEDFKNQKQIVLGYTSQQGSFEKVVEFYKKLFPLSELSICSSCESESMKIFCNSFYAVKVQFFNELFLLCKKLKIDFESVKKMMLKNGWINPMHTMVPGPDGQLSYGGACFPKDTNALNRFMINSETPNLVLEATIKEKERFRDDS